MTEDYAWMLQLSFFLSLPLFGDLLIYDSKRPCSDFGFGWLMC